MNVFQNSSIKVLQIESENAAGLQRYLVGVAKYSFFPFGKSGQGWEVLTLVNSSSIFSRPNTLFKTLLYGFLVFIHSLRVTVEIVLKKGEVLSLRSFNLLLASFLLVVDTFIHCIVATFKQNDQKISFFSFRIKKCHSFVVYDCFLKELIFSKPTNTSSIENCHILKC